MPTIECTSYLVYLARKKAIHKGIVTLADTILRKAKENNAIKGTNPIGIATTALYLAGFANGQKLSQRELAKLAGISEVTIRANCKILQEIAFKARSGPTQISRV
jgi:transcription initiation factor TFIIB